MNEYTTKPGKVSAIKMEKPPRRLNMMSNVYDYDQYNFSTTTMPVVGDYLVLDHLGAIPRHVGQKAFEKIYTKVDNG